MTAMDGENSSERLKSAVRSGTFATLATHVIGQVAQLVILAILYRLVSPAEFGLFGLAVPILMFLRMFASGGLHVATVGHAELTESQLGGMFWLNLAAGLVTTAIAAAVAPLAAQIYDVPELQNLLLALAATSLAGALAAQQQAVLERRLRWGRLSMFRIAAMLLGGVVAVAAAWRGAGVQALVAQMYAELVALAVLCGLAGAWPGWRFSTAGLRGVVQFGGLYLASSVVFYLVQYGDKLLLGWLVGDRLPEQVGFYTQAFNWTMKPVFLLTTPLSGVALATLARARGDRATRESLVLAFNRLAAVLMLPIGAGLMIVAPEAIVVLGGPDWSPAANVLRVLAATILVQAFINLTGSLLSATGNAAQLVRLSLGYAGWMLLTFGIGLYLGDQQGQPALGLALGYSLGLLTAFVPALVYCLRCVDIDRRIWFWNLRPAAQAAAAMAALVLAYHLIWVNWMDGPLVLLLCSEVTLGVVSYCWFARKELQWVLTQLGQLRR